MLSAREIRRRIKSITSTAQITRAMQMVAASRMRKTQEATVVARPFTELLYRIQRRATTHAGDFTHPLLQVREVRKRAVILVGTNKGLCGALNTNLFRLAAQFDPDSTLFITLGKRAAQFVAHTGRKLVAEFTFTDSPRFEEARPIATLARQMFENREVDQVQVVATRFVNTLTQQAAVLEFLPIGEIKAFEAWDIAGRPADEELPANTTEFLFEPDPGTVLSFFFGAYLNIYIYRVVQEAKASEQSARMVAMKNATDSALELIKHLTLEYNTLRQGNITKEILEIAGGQLGNE